MSLSIVTPFVNEFPQVVFCLRSIEQALLGLDAEVIAVDNWCEEVAQQNREPDRGHAHTDRNGKPQKGHIESMARKNEWLKCISYSEKLSHWCAKNAGVAESSGDLLMFMDAHVVPSAESIKTAIETHRQLCEEFNTEKITVHLPLTYHILETHRLIYRLVDNRETGEVAYSFTGYRDEPTAYEVPCMSTCGMLMSRSLFDLMDGWPPELGIYGGGEHFMNFVGAVIGVRKFIVPGVWLYHHGEKRGYHWNYTDNMRNRAIANYCFGGTTYLDRYMQYKKGRPEVKEHVRDDVIRRLRTRRMLIKGMATTTIDAWLDSWKEDSGDTGNG